MTKFSDHYNLTLSQPELDFVNIDLNADLPVYVDPFAISLNEDELSLECNNAIVDFFQGAITAITAGDTTCAERMLRNLSEPNETHLGVSSGPPQGRGVSGKQAFDLYQSLAASKAAKIGLISELSECDLFIDGIGPDKISDMTTNIIREFLIIYTQNQCNLHNIPLIGTTPSGFVWNKNRGIWSEKYTQLPRYNNQKILLVPKCFVRRKLSLNSQDYLNKHILEYLQAEHLHAGSGLVEVFKNGRRRVTKTALKANYPCTKEWMANFTKENPDVLSEYKSLREQIAKSERQAEIDWLNEGIDESLLAKTLIEKLRLIPAGDKHASDFHNIIIGVLEFLFWPNLVNPVKEQEIHTGRKRIDIMYTNAAESGFFYRALASSQQCASRIPVECKNYSKDPANPEIDQLAGRFAPHRGRMGFLLYRDIGNYKKLIERCKDTAIDGRGFIIPIGDVQIIEMLSDVADGKRERIDERLNNLLNMIIY